MNRTPSKRRTRIIITLVIILIALLAIGMSIYALANPQGVSTTSSNEKAGAVSISEQGVSPPTISIDKGDSITWTNQDSIAHALALTTLNPPEELTGFGSDEAIPTGGSYSFTFDSSGTFSYNDPANPEKVHGIIIVK